jgi:hypothetical protein
MELVQDGALIKPEIEHREAVAGIPPTPEDPSAPPRQRRVLRRLVSKRTAAEFTRREGVDPT